jgi:6-phosphofructokinase 2
MQVEHVVPTRKLRCNRPHYNPGGGGINVSRAIKRFGGTSTALFVSGGVNGQLLENLLEKEEIEYQAVEIHNMIRENFTILEEASGNQYRFNLPGPELQESEWKQSLSELETLMPKIDYVVGSGSLPPGVPDDFYARMAEMASAADTRCIVDTSGEALKHAVRQGVFLIKPNFRELKELVGKDIEDEADQEEYARELIQAGQAEVVVLSLGNGGALLVTQEDSERVRSPSVPIKSRIGAGDSMVGGMVFKLAQGESLQKAVLFGVAAGAAAVMTPHTELCRGDDTQQLYEALLEEYA